jgi:SWI/SNF-related matrix-associated actin-dependent regulator of chromatin subfamily A3
MNTVTGETQPAPPPPFRGGILADHMGLGKTLAMIALIASDLESPAKATSCCDITVDHDSAYQPIRCTLIVLPPSLINTWETQLSRHLEPGFVRWGRHHGNQRLTRRSQIASYDIVLTTYQTMASEWRKRHTTSSLIFSVCWNRVILDEAHCIRDRGTVTSQAVCSLEASRRWAMTGTPIQNRLNDFIALLKFLRVYPYNDPKIFESDITQLWKAKSEEKAIERLKNLINCICIRRSNATVELPKRTDKVYYLDFTQREKIKYDAARVDALELLDKALMAEHPPSASYLNVLQRINALRLICNLGLSAPASGTKRNAIEQDSEAEPCSGMDAQEAFDALVSMGEASCSRCNIAMSVPDHESMDTEDSGEIRISQCTRLVCNSCARKLETANGPSLSWCGHTSSCKSAAVSYFSPKYGASPSATNWAQDDEPIPTKMRALAMDIERYLDTKR